MVFSLLEKLSKRGKERRSKRGEGNEEANEKEKSNVTGIVQPADIPVPGMNVACNV